MEGFYEKDEFFSFFEVTEKNPLKFKLDTRVEKLYHYTSKEATINIAKNSCFWVTRSDYLNDTSEITYFKTILEKTIKKIKLDRHNNIRPNDEKGILYSMIINFLIHVNYNFQNLLNNKDYDFFILSCTYNGKSNYLWKNYSDSDGGIIELEPSKILGDFFKFNQNSDEFEFFSHAKVLYSKTEQIRTFYNHIIGIYEEATAIAAVGDFKCTNSGLWKEIKELILLSIHTYAQFFKSSIYKKEQEYRLVFVIGKNKDNPLIQFRKKSFGEPIPYIIFELEKESIVNIKS